MDASFKLLSNLEGTSQEALGLDLSPSLSNSTAHTLSHYKQGLCQKYLTTKEKIEKEKGCVGCYITVDIGQGQGTVPSG